MNAREKLAFLQDRLEEMRQEAAQLRADVAQIEQEAEALAYAIETVEATLAEETRSVAILAKGARDAAELICPPALTEKHKRLLGALRNVAKDGLAEASYRDLSQASSMPIASIRAGLSHLIMTGFIDLVRKGRGEAASRYRLRVRAGFGAERAKARAA
jgi:DNA repair exonuclease SbcCD ATPase subunit